MKGPISDSPIIILEGADATGKSTLAAELVQAQDRVAFHAGPPTANTWMAEYVESVSDTTQVQELVLDRWHLGEWVWPPIFGRESLFEDVLQMKACHDLLASQAFTIILVRPVLDIIDELSRRGESENDIVAAIEGQKSYLDMVRSANLSRTIATTLPVARELLGLT